MSDLNYPTGECLIVIAGEVVRSLGVCCSTNSKSRFDCDFYDNEADYLVRGADNVIREADGKLWVFAPNMTDPAVLDVPDGWGPVVGVWCVIPSLEALKANPVPADDLEVGLGR